MQSFSTTILTLLLAILIPSGYTRADPPDPVQEDVLRPSERIPSYGFIFGGNAVFSSGILITTCDCKYESGTGLGFAAGAYFELPLASEFTLIGQLLYSGLNASYSDTEERLEYTDDGDFMFLEFDKNADVSLSYIVVDILAKWNIYERELYLLAGPSVGHLIADNIHEKETMTTSGYTFITTGTNQKVYLDDEPLDELYDVNKSRVAFRFGLGYEIPVSSAMLISPEVTYSLPVTTIVEGFKDPVGEDRQDVTAWKHSALQLSVRIMFWI